ncbi:glycosyltransferase family 4 protein [Aquihabitans daechungensis]|uniref:glycosyltransferase family 4 protein n=1 Tax=Aquihabitans daechungensis TaxID=1052257 RepID=UPI003BA1F9D5
MNEPSLLAVVSRFPHPSETFIRRKLCGLAAAGMDVTVATRIASPEHTDLGLPVVLTAPWKYPRVAYDALGRSGVTAAARTAVGLQGARGASGSVSARRRVQLAPLVAVGADIVHFEFSGIAITYQDAFELLRPAKIAVSCRGAAEQILPLSDPRRARALESLFAEVDLIHCVSDDMRRTVESYGAPTEKILVNRPAVPVADFAPIAGRRQTHDGPLRVLSIGRLHWKKGFDDSLRAIAGLAASGRAVEYRIGGEGPEREKLSFLIHQLGLGADVTLLGVQRQDEIYDQLAWADVLLLPSLSEGISNAVLEAMASGLPVIATRCGGMDEVIDDGVDGFLVDIGDQDAMQARLEAVADDRDQAARLGRAAGARALAEFDLERQVRVFVDAYRRLGSA